MTDAPTQTATKAAGDDGTASFAPQVGGLIPVADPNAPETAPDRRRKAVLSVPIEVIISVGKARPLLSELVGLRRDSVLELDSKIEDPVEILIGDRVIARGELQEIDGETGRLGVRLTEVADLSQSL
ncbi:FliM/FliN family flagellar motor switch protein [Paludibacillus litoralis]|uniref:FliM/FliN family flagellar motor switch protein n=1 Tax=Paludibacillus litoralis TaxID=3133267 RepID=UPI0039B761BA